MPYCAGTFDGLVKEAVRAANAAAQLRADYAASVVAGDLAEAQRDRVASKRGKRRSASPKTPKKMTWAADEHLVHKRIFSTVCLQSSDAFHVRHGMSCIAWGYLMQWPGIVCNDDLRCMGTYHAMAMHCTQW